MLGELHCDNGDHDATEEIVEDAGYRATTLESIRAFFCHASQSVLNNRSTDAQAAFGPQNVNQALGQILQRLDDLTAEVRLGRAEAYNNAIISRNSGKKGDMPYLPLKKTVSSF